MPRKHIEEPGIWHQGGTWARSAIPPAFPSGAMTWHTLERHLFPTERGRNILHSQTTKLLSLLPVLGRLTHSKQIQPQLSCSCSEGTSAHFTHRNKALPPGGDETVGIKTVLKYVLQNIYREIWLIFFFFPEECHMGHWWCLIPPNRHGTIRETRRVPQNYCTIPTVTGQRSVHYSLQNWLFILYNLCISQLSPVKPLLGCHWASGLKLSQHGFCR